MARLQRTLRRRQLSHDRPGPLVVDVVLVVLAMVVVVVVVVVVMCSQSKGGLSGGDGEVGVDSDDEVTLAVVIAWSICARAVTALCAACMRCGQR